MIEFRLGVQDLAETSFALSPLQELAFSLRARRFPGVHAMHLPWLEQTREAFAELDTELLLGLVSERRWMPDFVTPRPVGLVTDVAEELALVRAVPPETVRAQVADTFRDGPPPEVLRGAPEELPERICRALEAYWASCVEPWWPRMRALLEADLVYRSRRLALGGAKALFSELDGRVTWHEGVIRLVMAPNAPEYTIDVAGRGMILVPSLFVRAAGTAIGGDGPPYLIYPARGLATLWEQGAPEGPAALVELIGAPRARLLALLGSPASTTELAHRLGVTPGAVSRHLTALHAGGLLNRARVGRSVLYMRSPLGDRFAGR